MRRDATRPQELLPAPTNATPPGLDRALISLGCDPAFIADLLGDLREEYVNRAANGGLLTARVWYVRELLRSTPHLAWNAARNGTPGTRARLATYLLAGIATLSVAAIAWATYRGPPARLVYETAGPDGIVVNHTRPVRLAMTVLDAGGHRLERNDVRYERLSGIPIPVSIRGNLRCTARGSALVRASLGALRTDFVIRCEPVRKIRFAGWGNFVVGDSARMLAVDAEGLDGEPVTRIAAKLVVADSTVATLDGSSLRPLKPGETSVEMEIGNETVETNVTVFERLRSLAELKPSQRWVAVPVRLARGESIRWPLPAGLFFLAFSTDTAAVPVTKAWPGSWSTKTEVSLSVEGPIMCMPEPRSGMSHTHCLARGPGATLTMTNARGRDLVVGTLALERQEQH